VVSGHTGKDLIYLEGVTEKKTANLIPRNNKNKRSFQDPQEILETRWRQS
jgi:hypothetical protein